MDTLPTFSGFPQAGLAFLANLAAHNNRVWFESQKKDYQALLLERSYRSMTATQGMPPNLPYESPCLEIADAQTSSLERGQRSAIAWAKRGNA
jgi:hypothetical protein